LMVIDFGLASSASDPQRKPPLRFWLPPDVRERVRNVATFRPGVDMLRIVYFLPEGPLREALMRDAGPVRNYAFNEVLSAPANLTAPFSAANVLRKLDAYEALLKERQRVDNVTCYVAPEKDKARQLGEEKSPAAESSIEEWKPRKRSASMRSRRK